MTDRPFAHRGLHDDAYPENSLPAFERAVQAGYNIELDVHLLADGRLAVFHDDTLERMTGERVLIRTLTRDGLSEHRLLGTEYCIPTLRSVLDLVRGRVALLIELKVERNARALAKALVRELDGYAGQVYVQSFHPVALRHMYRLAPQYARGQLSSYFEHDRLGVFKRLLIKKLSFARYSHIDFVSYHHSNLPNRYALKPRKPVLAWTVRSEDEYARVREHCDNIIFEGFLP